MNFHQFANVITNIYILWIININLINIDIECGLPASIPHGSYNLINNTISYTSIVKYACNEGYSLIGKAILSCDIDERWNGPPPRCAGLIYINIP